MLGFQHILQHFYNVCFQAVSCVRRRSRPTQASMAATAKNSAIIYGSSQMLSNTLWISTPMRPHRPQVPIPELIGAPFINGAALADWMNSKKLPGVIFTAAYFTPSASKHAGRRCEGVHIHLTDTKAYDTIRTGTALLYAIREIYPNDFALRQPEDEKALLPINRLTGSNVLAHDWPDFDTLMERWENEAKAFDERVAFARMYE